MSRRWDRAPRALLCGGCADRHIPAGDPVCYVKVGLVTRELCRCVDCAGPAPPDLPPLVEQQTAGNYDKFVTIGALKPKNRGALKALAKEWTPYRDSRDPGEDG